MVDVQQQIEAVERGVHTVERDGEQLRVQTLTQEYSASLGDVWDAATSLERIPRWFAPVEGDARLGGRYQVVGNAGGEVLECSPPADGRAHYRVTWEFGGGVTWLAVRLTAVGDDRTRLELEHTARVSDVPTEFFTQFGSGATGVGWDQALLGLSLHLGSGAGVAPSEAEAWMVGDEGKAFARAASAAWGAADVADGVDPDAASAAVEATYAFYTGQGPGAM